MKVTTAALGQLMQSNRGWADVDYYANGMLKMCSIVKDMNGLQNLPPTATFMSGRRVVHNGPGSTWSERSGGCWRSVIS